MLIKEYTVIRNTKIPFRGVLCILGSVTVLLSFAIHYSYSNLNTYITSYMRTTGYNDDLTYADFIFISSANAIVNGLLNPFLGVLSSKIGSRRAILLGSLVFSVGQLLTCLTVQSYFGLVVLTITFHAVGFGLCYSTAAGCVQRWFPVKVRGFVTSIVIAGYGYGSLIWVPVQTTFVNPDNIPATIDKNCPYANSTEDQDKCLRYFTDPEVLDRIPNLFLLLGGIYVLFGIVAGLLVSDPPDTYNPELEEPGVDMETGATRYHEKPIEATTCNGEPAGATTSKKKHVEVASSLENPAEVTNTPGNHPLQTFSTHTDSEPPPAAKDSLDAQAAGDTSASGEDNAAGDAPAAADVPDTGYAASVTDTTVDDHEQLTKNMTIEPVDLTPLQLLKTRSFYLLWLSFLGIHIVNGLLAIYNKTFGLSFINDDHYFYKISIMANVINGTARIVWGILYDRIKFRGCYLIIATVTTIFIGTLPLLPRLGSNTVTVRALFGLWMAVLNAVLPCIYVIVSTVCRDLYGKTHYKANLGMLFTVNIGATFVSLIVTKVPAIFSYLGMGGLFYFSAVCGALGIFSALFLPNKEPVFALSLPALRLPSRK